jgi:hypothetical protein
MIQHINRKNERLQGMAMRRLADFVIEGHCLEFLDVALHVVREIARSYARIARS